MENEGGERKQSRASAVLLSVQWCGRRAGPLTPGEEADNN